MTMAISGMKVAGVLPGVLMVAAPLAIVGLLSGTSGNAVELKPKPITVTGCLQTGPGANEFMITTKGGKRYEVVRTSLALGGHVGHIVTIKGTFRSGMAPESKATERTEKKSGGGKAEEHVAGHIETTSLTMVSTTCS
jgi:hypothetical protein